MKYTNRMPKGHSYFQYGVDKVPEWFLHACEYYGFGEEITGSCNDSFIMPMFFGALAKIWSTKVRVDVGDFIVYNGFDFGHFFVNIFAYDENQFNEFLSLDWPIIF